MMELDNKPVVVYLANEPLGIKYLEEFIANYQIFRSGFDHDLVICFKGFSEKKLSIWENSIKINYIKFDDSNQNNDFDIGSFVRIAKKYSDRHILFLGTYTKPVTNDWLKIFLNHYKKNSIVGATASCASLASMFLNFFFEQHTIFQQIRWGLYHLIHVKLFPNPHIRTTGFFIKGKDFLSVNFDLKKFTNKKNTNYFESGRRGLSNQLLKKGFDLIIVNSDNRSFKIHEWKNSQTYCLGNQEKLLFTDNRTEEYKNSSIKEKEKRAKFCWGTL